MGNNLSIYPFSVNENTKKIKKTCDCGEFAPFIKGGSCRNCFGYLKAELDLLKTRI